MHPIYLKISLQDSENKQDNSENKVYRSIQINYTSGENLCFPFSKRYEDLQAYHSKTVSHNQQYRGIQVLRNHLRFKMG